MFAREKDEQVEARRLLERQLRDEQMVVERNAVQHAQQVRPHWCNSCSAACVMVRLSKRCRCGCVRLSCKTPRSMSNQPFGAPQLAPPVDRHILLSRRLLTSPRISTRESWNCGACSSAPKLPCATRQLWHMPNVKPLRWQTLQPSLGWSRPMLS